MKTTLILKIAGILYKHGFRDLLIKWIDIPESKGNDQLILALDAFFGYTSKKSQ